MDRSKGRKKKFQPEPKLSFGSALKKNVRYFHKKYVYNNSLKNHHRLHQNIKSLQERKKTDKKK